jgi:hypothetical protein
MPIFAATKPLPGKKKSFPGIEGRALPPSVRIRFHTPLVKLSSERPFKATQPHPSGIAHNSDNEGGLSILTQSWSVSSSTRGLGSKIPVKIKTDAFPVMMKCEFEDKIINKSKGISKIPLRLKVKDSTVPRHMDAVAFTTAKSIVTPLTSDKTVLLPKNADAFSCVIKSNCRFTAKPTLKKEEISSTEILQEHNTDSFSGSTVSTESLQDMEIVDDADEDSSGLPSLLPIDELTCEIPAHSGEISFMTSKQRTQIRTSRRRKEKKKRDAIAKALANSERQDTEHSEKARAMNSEEINPVAVQQEAAELETHVQIFEPLDPFDLLAPIESKIASTPTELETQTKETTAECINSVPIDFFKDESSKSELYLNRIDDVLVIQDHSDILSNYTPVLPKIDSDSQFSLKSTLNADALPWIPAADPTSQLCNDSSTLNILDKRDESLAHEYPISDISGLMQLRQQVKPLQAYVDHLQVSDIPMTVPAQAIVFYFENAIGPVKMFNTFLDNDDLHTCKASVSFWNPGDATRALLLGENMVIGSHIAKIELFVNGTPMDPDDVRSTMAHA